ncbi:MAG: PAS domain-containing protein [Candidatus Aenigmarchaeota archaeon]|nr:PAS domain-containing protein [Candidatus Aenigmarchaeota archaeon]
MAVRGVLLSKKIGKRENIVEKIDKNSILDGMSELVALQDTNHTIFWVNKAAADSLKSKRKDLIGKHCYELLARKKAPCDNCPIEISKKTRKPHKSEIKTYDGRMWSISSYPIKDSNGRLIGFTEVSYDITEKKTMGNELKESEIKFRRVFENLPFISFILDTKGNLISGNKYAENLIGLKTRDFSGKPFSSFGLLDKKGLLKAFFEFRKNLKGKITDKTVYDIKTKDGRKLTVELMGIPINEDGKVVSVLDVGSDITESRKTHDKIIESEKKYKFLVDSTMELIVIISRTGKILFANKAMLDSFGYKEEEVVGKSMIRFMTRESIKDALYLIAQEFMGKKQKESELHLKAKNGEIRTVLFAEGSTPVYENGKMTGLLVNGRDVTEIKKAEQELRDSEERFRMIFENANDAIILLDRKGNVIEANSRIYDVLGYRAKDIMGKSFAHSGVIRIQDLPRIMKVFANSTKKGVLEGGGETNTMQFQLKHGKGNKVFVEVSTTFIKKEGKTESILTMMRDVTDRVEWEKRLKESEEKYRKQFEEALDAIFVADADTGIITDCNKAAEKLTGRKKSEIIGKHQRILHPPSKKKDKFTKEFREHLSEKKGGIIESRVITGDGKLRDVSIKANIIEMGGKKFLQGIFRDITERKKSEEMIRKNEERFHMLFKRMPDSSIVLDRKGKFLEASEEAERMSGYKVSEVVGRNLFEMPILDIKTKAIVAKKIISVFTEGKVSDFEIVINSKRGKKIPIEISARMIEYMDGKAVLVIMRDISDRIKRDKELRESEERFRNIFESSNDAIFVHDLRTGEIFDVNQKACELFGYTKDKLKKMNVGDISSGRDPYTQRNAVKKIRTVSEEGPVVFEWVSRDSRGRVFGTEINLKIVVLSGKRRILAIIRDIENRKRWEKQLMQSKKELEEKVEELEKFSKISVGRELQMVKLKERINELEKKLKTKPANDV